MSRSTRWYETFFGGLYAQVLAGQTDEAKTLAEARTIRKVLGLRKGQRVLDCPCGMGRIAFALARLGLDAAGADLTALYVRRARRRAKDEGLDIPFVRCDMRELPFEGEFDAVVNWFTSFGYFDEAGNLATARAAFAALKPGGQFLIELLNRSWLLPRFCPTSDELIGGVRIVRSARWDADGGRVFNTWTMSKGKKVETHEFWHRLYNAAEMRSLLWAAGFRDIRFLGRPPLGRFTRHCRRMIAVGTRPLE
jgi:SAM-dependent methyltransferase